ncbi:MAG: Fe-S cluster assembly ATPase SufC [Candidatus Levybacteria bacterium]|nr:Fe-S cluster assembly ATPase SufC [Candidatus Levybacteria bacterium]
MLVIKNLHITTQEKEIIKGLDITIESGEVHAVMGPNGAGKTTLAMGLMGQPQFKIQSGDRRTKFKINGEDMLNKLPEERARAGLFVSFQQPVEITGVSVLSFLRTAYKALYPEEKVSLSEFKEQVKRALSTVSLPQEFMQRSLNEGFSGGEKKRAETAQLLILKPKYAILDEIDSGLDVDSLRAVARAIKQAVEKYKIGILLITHYQRILHHLKPNYVHVLIDGKIKKSDGMTLVEKIERDGYAAV